MTELDLAVARFKLLNDKEIDDERYREFYGKYINMPIAYLQKLLDSHKDESRELECKVIPDLMLMENRRSVETTDGVTIKIRSEINASLKNANMEEVVKWLEDKGYGAIVRRRHFVIDDIMVKKAEADGIVMYQDYDVNTNTLKKILREHFEKTDELPVDVMPVSIFNHAIIKFEKDEIDE